MQKHSHKHPTRRRLTLDSVDTGIFHERDETEFGDQIHAAGVLDFNPEGHPISEAILLQLQICLYKSDLFPHGHIVVSQSTF